MSDDGDRFDGGRLMPVGKSLTVHNVVRSFWDATAWEGGASTARCTAVSVNCATLQAPRAVFRRALQGFREHQSTLRGDPIIYPGTCCGAYCINQCYLPEGLPALKAGSIVGPSCRKANKPTLQSMMSIISDKGR